MQQDETHLKQHQFHPSHIVVSVCNGEGQTQELMSLKSVKYASDQIQRNGHVDYRTIDGF